MPLTPLTPLTPLSPLTPLTPFSTKKLSTHNSQLSTFYYICSMKRLFALLKVWLQGLRKYISPVFLVLLGVSFTLWYISKLNYTYTTDFNIKVKVDGERIIVPCVVEGKGTTLLGYGVYTSSNAKFLRSEIKHSIIEEKVLPEGATDSVVVARKMHIAPTAMQDALSVRFSDLKFVSVGYIPEIELPIK